jgi:uncharacterized protein GlcG (DUF336 family)
MMNISSDQTDHVIQAAQSSAGQLGVAACIAVLDAAGHLKCFTRMDRAWLGAIDVAIKKARTSILFEADTEQIWEVCKPNAPAHGLEFTNDGLVTFAGGIPLRDARGELCGAIGVSGGQVGEDREIAKAGQRAWLQRLTSSSHELIDGEISC